MVKKGFYPSKQVLGAREHSERDTTRRRRSPPRRNGPQAWGSRVGAGPLGHGATASPPQSRGSRFPWEPWWPRGLVSARICPSVARSSVLRWGQGASGWLGRKHIGFLQCHRSAWKASSRQGEQGCRRFAWPGHGHGRAWLVPATGPFLPTGTSEGNEGQPGDHGLRHCHPPTAPAPLACPEMQGVPAGRLALWIVCGTLHSCHLSFP